jgi:hypothetical protein
METLEQRIQRVIREEVVIPGMTPCGNAVKHLLRLTIAWGKAPEE